MPINTTSTSITIPPPQPNIPPSYDEWGAIKLVVGGCVAAILGINAILSLVKAIVDFFEKKRASDKEKDMPDQKRIESLERAAGTFRSAEYLDKEFERLEDKIQHNRNNQAVINERFNDTIKDNQHEISDLKLNAAMLKGKVEVLSENTGRLETKVDTLRDRIEERFDRLTEHLGPNKTT